MNAQEQLLRGRLDTANFKTLLANTKNAVPNAAELKSANEATIRAHIEQIKAYAKDNPGDRIVQANSHLIQANAVATETWTAGPGDFSITSAYKWAVGGGVSFPGEIPLAFLFGGTGESWKAWATGTQVIIGSFVVDPQKIVHSGEFHEEDSPIGRVRKGPCKFTASGGGAGVSGVTISFYSSTTGAYWGTLGGTGAIIGGFSIEGELQLVWQGWR